MPQDGSNNYYYPPGTPGVPDTTIESEAYNTFLNDLVTNDLNIARPIHRGGTGAINAASALVNLGAEKSNQGPVANFDTHPWVNGSFYCNAGATGAPTGDPYVGIFYAHANTDYATIEARNITGTPVGALYVRQKIGGVWGGWHEQVSSLSFSDDRYVNQTGDTMSGPLTIIKSVPAGTTLPFIIIDGGYGDYAAIPTIDFRVNSIAASPCRIGADLEGAQLDLVFFASNNYSLDGVERMRLSGLDGTLKLTADPTVPLHAATKQYADTKLPLVGGNMTGIIYGVPSSGTIATTASGSMQVMGAGGANASAMTFHMPGVFVCSLGLDSDAQFKIGGGSFGTVAHKIAHAGVGELIPHGQCYLQFDSATQISLRPQNGTAIRINGVTHHLPPNGITISNAGLTANTGYYVYVFISGGIPTLHFSASPRVTDTTTPGNLGVQIATGNPAYTFVGLIFANSAAQFQDDVSARTVASWFNRKNKVTQLASANTSGGATVMTPWLFTGYNCVFAGDYAEASHIIMLSNTGVGGYCGVSVFGAGAQISGTGYSFAQPTQPGSVEVTGRTTHSADSVSFQFAMAFVSSSAGNGVNLQNPYLYGIVRG